MGVSDLADEKAGDAKLDYDSEILYIRTVNGNEDNVWDRERSFPKYSISVVAIMTGVQTYTLRQYDQCGLVRPARTEGKTRRYSDADLELIQEIGRLARLGVNYAGIREVLRLRRQWYQMKQWPSTEDEETETRVDQEETRR